MKYFKMAMPIAFVISLVFGCQKEEVRPLGPGEIFPTLVAMQGVEGWQGAYLGIGYFDSSFALASPIGRTGVEIIMPDESGDWGLVITDFVAQPGMNYRALTVGDQPYLLGATTDGNQELSVHVFNPSDGSSREVANFDSGGKKYNIFTQAAGSSGLLLAGASREALDVRYFDPRNNSMHFLLEDYPISGGEAYGLAVDDREGFFLITADSSLQYSERKRTVQLVRFNLNDIEASLTVGPVLRSELGFDPTSKEDQRIKLNGDYFQYIGAVGLNTRALKRVDRLSLQHDTTSNIPFSFGSVDRGMWQSGFYVPFSTTALYNSGGGSNFLAIDNDLELQENIISSVSIRPAPKLNVGGYERTITIFEETEEFYYGYNRNVVFEIEKLTGEVQRVWWAEFPGKDIVRIDRAIRQGDDIHILGEAWTGLSDDNEAGVVGSFSIAE